MNFKKLMMAAAIAGIASTGFCDITSQAVGYEGAGTLVAGKFNMLNLPFVVVSGQGYGLNKSFTVENGTKGSDEATSDTILFWNASTSGYKTYFYYAGGEGYSVGWYGAESGELFETDYPDGMTPGTPYWYKALSTASTITATNAGEVPTEDSYTFSIVKGKFNMIAAPYPSALKLNDNITVSSGTQGADETASDTILFWDASTSGYKTYFYYAGGEGYTAGWYGAESGELFETDHPNGLVASQAPFWYKALGTGSASITFTKPF